MPVFGSASATTSGTDRGAPAGSPCHGGAAKNTLFPYVPQPCLGQFVLLLPHQFSLWYVLVALTCRVVPPTAMPYGASDGKLITFGANWLLLAGQKGPLSPVAVNTLTPIAAA